MEGLLTFLLFAGLFFLMMRFGCGAHMVHGGHGTHGGHGSHREGRSLKGGPAADALDPVCGMAVNPATGYGRMYQGLEYRFCSRTCLDKFDSAPGSYAGRKGA